MMKIVFQSTISISNMFYVSCWQNLRTRIINNRLILLIKIRNEKKTVSHSIESKQNSTVPKKTNDETISSKLQMTLRSFTTSSLPLYSSTSQKSWVLSSFRNQQLHQINVISNLSQHKMIYIQKLTSVAM